MGDEAVELLPVLLCAQACGVQGLEVGTLFLVLFGVLGPSYRRLRVEANGVHDSQQTIKTASCCTMARSFKSIVHKHAPLGIAQIWARSYNHALFRYVRADMRDQVATPYSAHKKENTISNTEAIIITLNIDNICSERNTNFKPNKKKLWIAQLALPFLC